MWDYLCSIKEGGGGQLQLKESGSWANFWLIVCLAGTIKYWLKHKPFNFAAQCLFWDKFQISPVIQERSEGVVVLTAAHQHLSRGVSGLFRSILCAAFKARLLVGDCLSQLYKCFDIYHTWHPTSRQGRAHFNRSVGITVTNVCGENERNGAYGAHGEL